MLSKDKACQTVLNEFLYHFENSKIAYFFYQTEGRGLIEKKNF